jgi:nucleoside 2-deoxyribosyltransferase
MKKVYLAAAFWRKEEMKELSLRIKELGVKVTSRWLDEEPLPEGKIKRKRFLENTAAMDANDVFAADTLIRFSDDLSTKTVPSSWCTCSRMEETGFAHAWGKQIIIVGAIQSLFDRFPQRIILKNTDELLEYIRKHRG